MRNVICIPFAFDENMSSGVNVRTQETFSMYLKNVCVALISSKKNNIDCEVMLATNLRAEQMPQDITGLLKENEIIINTIPFDRFCFPDDYLWSLAFYKLCVLSYLIEMGYDNICYMDADVYVQENFDILWQECSRKVMLYDINHGLHTDDYRIICNEFAEFTGEKNCFLSHYGGEFFAANRKDAGLFIEYANAIHKEMLDRGFVTTKGDEFIISLAADRMKEQVKNAGAYIFRFWTGFHFRLVATCYEHNAVFVLHLPAEKERGMLKIYDKYIRKGKLPSRQVVWRICRLSRQPIPEVLLKKVKKIIGR